MAINNFQSEFRISDRTIGPGAPCLVIAEAGVNHFGSMDKAFALVDLAVEAGADFVKFQHFQTDKLFGPSAPEWRERLRSKELSNDQIKSIYKYCGERSITFICTGHDEESVEFLDQEIDVPAFKIGSGEVGNLPWLRKIARLGKPIILSTGLYELTDIYAAAEVIADEGCRQLAILHCVTSYPTEPADVNLSVMGQIREFFPGPVGYSDHTAGTAVPLAAVALGADVLEKHITIDRDVPNAQDWKVSCDPTNLSSFISDLRDVEAAVVGGKKILSMAEQESILWARKSLTAKVDIAKGTVLTEDLIVAQRPGDGMTPSRIGELLEKCACRDIIAGTKITLEMIE
ncbi:MAG: N-acetylneuraminate synthase family protein [Rhodospirillales bacterium]|nr:N-acetylneuraminate synthase family protein [Rhodospirillales bacterium]